MIADYYRDHYAIEPAVIPYGAEFPAEEARTAGAPRPAKEQYLLYVSRFEPENNPLEVEAYETATATADRRPRLSLVMLGKGLYAPGLVEELPATRSDKSFSRARCTAATTDAPAQRAALIRPRRSAVRIPPSSRPWPRGAESWPTTRRKTGK